MEAKKKCSRCKQEKERKDFPKQRNRKDGLRIYCRACTSLINKECKERKLEPGYVPRKRIRQVNLCPYGRNTLEADVWMHFNNFGLNLEKEKEKVEEIICRLKNATSFWQEIDAIECELGCKDYNAPIAEVLRIDRQRINIGRDKYTGNTQQRVRMLTMDGEYIRSFDHISDASEFVCGNRVRLCGSIGNCAAGNSLSAAGYIFEFDDDNFK